MRILLIEDDKNMCRALAWQFEQNKDKIDCCHNGTDALLYTKTDSYDLILLDCILPEVSGLTVLKDLRARQNYTPVIILSALGEVENRIEGLNAGADDYLVKPFEFGELLARIRSIFRRKNSFMENHAAFGDLTLNITENILSAGEKTCSLSHTEGELMRLLLEYAENTIPRHVLMQKVWGIDTDVEDGNLDNYIYFLRKRLKTLNSSVKICNRRGQGYYLSTVRKEPNE